MKLRQSSRWFLLIFLICLVTPSFSQESRKIDSLINLRIRTCSRPAFFTCKIENQNQILEEKLIERTIDLEQLIIGRVALSQRS